jgi:hypothetical protein
LLARPVAAFQGLASKALKIPVKRSAVSIS